MWYKWTKSEHDYLVDRLIKAEDNIEKLTKQLSIAVVVGQSEQYYCYKENHGADRCKEDAPCKDCSCYN